MPQTIGLGAVLGEIHENKTERIVAFASRTSSSAERKYSTIEREALACVWAVENLRNIWVILINQCKSLI